VRKSGLLVWWFVGVKPFLNALVKGHISVVSYVSDSPEPLSVLMELGFLLFGVGPDHADADPLLGTLEFPLDSPPRLR
jgi:hypothetical protein